jgi:hypothetical protein
MESREAISVQSSHIFEDNTMESFDLALELNALRYNSHLDSDFDSLTEIDEFSERIIERSNPKPAQIKREVSRLAEPYQPANNSATRNEKSATD